MSDRITGVCKFFNVNKGFGFIERTNGGKDVFLHVSALEASGIESVSEGTKLEFDLVEDKRGIKAANVKVLG
jgi:CspA family cold shock protein